MLIYKISRVSFSLRPFFFLSGLNVLTFHTRKISGKFESNSNLFDISIRSILNAQNFHISRSKLQNDSSVNSYLQKSRVNCANNTTSRVNREDDATCSLRRVTTDWTRYSRFADKVNEAECQRFVQTCKVRASPAFRHFAPTLRILSYAYLSPTIPAITSFSNVLLTYRTGMYSLVRSLAFLVQKLSFFLCYLHRFLFN